MIARALATWFGSGLVPKAPGTAGTLATVPLAVLLMAGPRWVLPAAALALTLVGAWAAGRHALELGRKDPPQVVVDESAGYLWACCGGAAGWPTLLAAFLLFRVLDVLKPWPIRALESLPGGWGIMMDDVAAGLIAAALIASAGALAGAP